MLLLLLQIATAGAGGQLLSAAARGDAKAVERAILAQQPLEATDSEGRTAMLLAARGGHLRAVRALIDAGADLKAIDADGWGALLLAEAEEHWDVVELLHDEGAEYLLHREHDAPAERDTDPELLRKPPDPKYPRIARNKRVSGDVVLRVLVRVDGSTEVLEVVRPVLYCTARAVEHAERFLWRPGQADERPVAAIGMITVTYDLFANPK